jgi:hypothetical protein
MWLPMAMGLLCGCVCMFVSVCANLHRLCGAVVLGSPDGHGEVDGSAVLNLVFECERLVCGEFWCWG